MDYHNIRQGTFQERPNRFIAYVEIEGSRETVHVKNTGRCAELLIPGVTVYVQEADQPGRKTRWDLIGVEKGSRLVNIDSQVPNQLVKEWLEEGNLFERIDRIRPEYTYGSSRFDLYVEADGKKIFIEVKGVTLEEDGVVRFPDAPSERAVKHVEELKAAVEEGYEAYVFFVVQMKDVRYFTPNMDTHPAFGEALFDAAAHGVHVLAYDCQVERESIHIVKQVPVVLREVSGKEPAAFQEMVSVMDKAAEPVVAWFQEHKRDLPWRRNPDAYRVWVSEIMLQQTRVEAVKPYYERFLKELPTVEALAEAKEDKLLKLWEGLGYYNRVRNMQKAAQQIMIDYQGRFPDTYEEIRSLKGIGNYTAGAISAFAYGIPKPAVDGNVLRVVSRLVGSREDIMKQSVRKKMEEALERVIPADAASDFNQGLIELGAIVCVPNGEAKCGECPVAGLCEARKRGLTAEIPVKSRSKARRVEHRTVFLFRDGKRLAIRKRPSKGLLAGLYEFPSETGKMSLGEAAEYSKKIGLAPVRIKELGEAKHVFSHVEWHMQGYRILLENTVSDRYLFADLTEIRTKYPLPNAFSAYIKLINRES